MIGEKTISLCMVVYNPGQLLIEAIDSVDEIIDEIILVDQGSSEEESRLMITYLNGKQIGGKSTFYHKTTNKGNADYDRQFCYSLASKEYILALDADETISEENLLKIKKLLSIYSPDCVWFLFKNTIFLDGVVVDLKDLLGDDPHPRLWKKDITVNGQPTPALLWPIEAHQYPNILSDRQIYANIFFDHNRSLENVIRTHLLRGKNISPQAREVEKKFIQAVLKKFGDEVKQKIIVNVPELEEYLK